MLRSESDLLKDKNRVQPVLASSIVLSTDNIKKIISISPGSKIDGSSESEGKTPAEVKGNSENTEEKANGIIEENSKEGEGDGNAGKSHRCKNCKCKCDFNPCCCMVYCGGRLNLRFVCRIIAIGHLLLGIVFLAPILFLYDTSLSRIEFAAFLTVSGLVLLIAVFQLCNKRAVWSVGCWISSTLMLVNLLLTNFYSISKMNDSEVNKQQPHHPQTDKTVAQIITDITFLGTMAWHFCQLYFALCAFAMGFKYLNKDEDEPAHGCKKRPPKQPNFPNRQESNYAV